MCIYTYIYTHTHNRDRGSSLSALLFNPQVAKRQSISPHRVLKSPKLLRRARAGFFTLSLSLSKVHARAHDCREREEWNLRARAIAYILVISTPTYTRERFGFALFLSSGFLLIILLPTFSAWFFVSSFFFFFLIGIYTSVLFKACLDNRCQF